VLNGADPVYRFYNQNLGTHFYTTSETERAAIEANDSNYIFETIDYYVPASDTTLETEPLYRFYNSGTTEHIFSLDDTAPEGFVSEGIAYQVLS